MSPSGFALFARRRAEHRCVHCGEQLPTDEKRRLCARCRDRQAGRGSSLYRQRLLAVVCTRCGGPRKNPVYRYCEKCRERALVKNRRQKGIPLERPVKAWTKESPRWLQLEAPQHRCRCGLLLPCNSCLPPIHFYATSRPGPREAGLYTMKHPRGQ